MAAQFLLNLFIALLWVLLKDEDVLRWQTIVVGFIVGSVILYMMRRFFGGRFYLHRFLSMIKLILIFISETIQSTIVVIKHIITPKIDIEPGIFSYKTELHSDWEVTTLALLLTLTPGSVVMEVNEEGNVFYIHAMDINRYKSDLERSLNTFEKAIMEVTR
ncbi:Na+/H+ antiporter subunit E [Pseudogracilibacillus sp. ICA-222130]|uniref:Na+/H+ antiporter subunit E n=1 Tax=Pseudogracilibacillus sp. ICA-222130 TaxID=3134655 RepID=UPI0030C2D682